MPWTKHHGPQPPPDRLRPTPVTSFRTDSRVAITGVGAVTPIGVGHREFLAGWRGGVLAITEAPWAARAPLPLLTARVPDVFDPRETLSEREIASTDRCAQYALVAAGEALSQAGLDEPESLDPLRTAVVDGTAAGGLYSIMLGQHRFDTGGIAAIPPKTMLAGQANTAAARIALRHGLHGPLRTVTTACASALDALATGLELLALDRADVVVCGGSDSAAVSESEEFVPVFSIAGRVFGMETPEVDPKRAVLPFDVARSGIVFGEGAAWLVLESAAHVEARGGEPLCWVLGVGSCADSHHPSASDPTGQWQARAMELALADASLAAHRVDFVMAHATGTPKGDLSEARALGLVFGGSGAQPPVSSLKGHTGHTGGSSGTMSLIAAIDALRTGILEPVLGTNVVDPEMNIDVVSEQSRPVGREVAMVNVFGFGGQNTVALIGAP